MALNRPRERGRQGRLDQRLLVVVIAVVLCHEEVVETLRSLNLHAEHDLVPWLYPEQGIGPHLGHGEVAQLRTEEKLHCAVMTANEEVLAGGSKCRLVVSVPVRYPLGCTAFAKIVISGTSRCRRRDSNPRHADYDSAALTD